MEQFGKFPQIPFANHLLLWYYLVNADAGVAQLVERNLAKV